MTDFDVAENLGASTDQNAVANFRMAVACLLAGATERHVMQNRDIVLDHGGFTDHEAGGVVEENAAANPRGRMDIALEHRRRPALQVVGEIPTPFVPEPMGEAMRLDCVKALEVKDRLEKAVGRRIAVEGRNDVSAKGRADRSIVIERIRVGLADQFG